MSMDHYFLFILKLEFIPEMNHGSQFHSGKWGSIVILLNVIVVQWGDFEKSVRHNWNRPFVSK